MTGPGTVFLFGGSYGTSFHAEKWLSLDVCGMLGVTCSWAVHIYALVVIAVKLLSNSMVATVIYFGAYVPAALLAMASLYKAWTTDPGAVPLGARPLTIFRRASSESLGASSNGCAAVGSENAPTLTSRRAMRRCHKCNDNYKPPRAHHDSVTGRCVVKFDHFCPWVGNAVGALNHKFFCLFLLYTAITCVLSMLLLLLRALHCGYTVDSEEGKEAFEGGGRREGETIYKYPECESFFSSRLVLGLFICSLIFLVFTLSMGCEQIEAVETGKGKIARMKMGVGTAGTEFRTVTEEFNEMFGGQSPRVALHWFLPNNVEFPRGMKKVVLGYEWDPSFDPEPYEPTDASLGDQEMSELENGQRPSPTRAAAAAAAAPTQDVLLNRDSEMDLPDISVHSDTSAPSGMKNRKSPPNTKTID
eukprot:CAMPEP_0172453182 /NCGR_PEP_ID=MMETSP1065-20121228/10624_1 /TAXON_ID=265537 /ORGANISM="Amphiprora paludosa, Strain CCMP125" /LENGTH=416 /DNA_ID=CAMNT_0013205357 /DNA_START=272 /DNA_END=1522 /DNA_ORIENTATION=-